MPLLAPVTMISLGTLIADEIQYPGRSHDKAVTQFGSFQCSLSITLPSKDKDNLITPMKPLEMEAKEADLAALFCKKTFRCV